MSGAEPGLTTTYRARTVVTMDGAPLANGAVTVQGAQIVDVGPHDQVRTRQSGPWVDLGEVVLLPGLINAHCHLDYTCLRDLVRPQSSFADWIRQINGLRRELSDEEFLHSIAQGFTDARRWGTTTIGNIESMPALLASMPAPPLRTWWFAELIDVRPDRTAEEILENCVSLLQSGTNWNGGFGLSPHAPYTASAKLTQLAVAAARRSGYRLTTHLAESAEEMEMFRDGRGKLFELLRALGRPMDDCGHGHTPLAVMLDREVIDEQWIVVHLNELTEEDFGRLERGPRFHIAHCPRSSRYFAHRPFALSRLRELEFNICLGTDSLASNSSLSLFAEMQTLHDLTPGLPPERILEMVTTNAARALGQEDLIGKIRPGFQADLISLPIENRESDLFDAIVGWQEPVEWMLGAGAALPL